MKVQSSSFPAVEFVRHGAGGGGGLGTALILGFDAGTPSVDDGVTLIFRADNEVDENVNIGAIAAQITDISVGSEDGQLLFFTTSDGVDRIQMVINPEGNVGIGTDSPNEQLEIAGNFRLPATTATTGIIMSDGNPFIHNFGSANFFCRSGCG